MVIKYSNILINNKYFKQYIKYTGDCKTQIITISTLNLALGVFFNWWFESQKQKLYVADLCLLLLIMVCDKVY